MKELRVESGSFLAAAPDLRDPNFMHSVVLVCQHSEDGAYGLVINRPSKVTVGELLPDHPMLGSSPFPVHLGGPVGRDTLQFLHRLPEEIPGGIPLAGGIFLGGELELLAEVLGKDEGRAAESVRLLVGYSGWGEGQLDAELAIGSWIPAPVSATFAFAGDPEKTWRGVVRSIGEEGRGLADLPPDVRWN